MKTKIFLILFTITTFCNAQIINIPDANFKAKLLEASPSNQIASRQNPTIFNGYPIFSNYDKIDINNDNEIQLTEIQDITYLNISNDNFPNNSTITDLTGINYFTNLYVVSAVYNSISYVDFSSNLSLMKINLISNNISNINLSGLNNLKELLLSNNHLTNINLVDLTNLKTLEITYNNLSNLDVSNLINLKWLSCNDNYLTNLNIQNLPYLEELYCYSNQINSIDLSNLSSLNTFRCEDNLLTSLSLSNFPNLNTINCGDNLLTILTLANLPNLSFLGCNDNQLTTLNVSNFPNLSELHCYFNQLENIVVSQNPNLFTLLCFNNNLTSLDVSQNNILNSLDCSHNELIQLNIKNNSSHAYPYVFSDNNNLTYICSDEEDLAEIEQKIIDYGYTNCHVNSYCSFTPGGIYYTLQGNQKFDINSNGCDSNDLIYPNFKCSITDGTNTGTFITNNSGNYSIPVQAGTHTVTPIIENTTYFNVSPTFINVSFPSTSSPFTQDFCISPNGSHNDLEVLLLPINAARPGFDANYKIVYKNKGTTTQSGTINFTFDDSVLDFVSSNPNVSSQSTGNLNWNFANLLPFESREIDIVLNLNSPIETPALNSGDTLYYTFTINGQTDETPNDNIATLNQIVVNSYDPNDKTCLEGTTITPNMVGEYVHYLIRFENNGTANAQNIVVKDMIDINKFDINTLIPIKGSHSFETRISSTNKVEFIFQNINLPFDDANNDGYVSFKIKTKPNLVVGNTFSNSANIYFDYNFPIVTNNYTTTVQNTLGIQENNFINNISVYPNPVKNILNFKTEHNISKIEVYDIAGRILSSNSISENKIDLSELKTGNYILKLYTEKGIMNTKIIKE